MAEMEPEFDLEECVRKAGLDTGGSFRHRFTIKANLPMQRAIQRLIHVTLR